MDVLDVIDEVEVELVEATGKHGPFNTAHEGKAVIEEELDELWDEIKKKGEDRDVVKMRKEAIQIAAMAIRFVMDICS